VVDVIITEKCVLQVDAIKGLTLTEVAEGYTAADIIKCTGCPIQVTRYTYMLKLLEIVYTCLPIDCYESQAYAASSNSSSRIQID
jgi:hypothetical protein